MRYFGRAPVATLRPYVRALWHYEGYAPDHRTERVLPSGTVEMTVLLDHESVPIFGPGNTEASRDEKLLAPLVAGVHRSFFVIATAPQRRCMGVHFEAGGADALLGLPSDAIADRQVSLEDLWTPTTARRLRNRLCSASDPEARFRIVEDTLLQRAKHRRSRPAWIDAALEAMHKAPNRPIADLARECGVSHRRFTAGFKRAVGLPPRPYGRIVRFQRILPDLRRSGDLDWCDVALACGYYDQSHFIRDFKAFSGLTPTAYRRLALGHLAVVPDAEKGQICPIPAAASGTRIEVVGTHERASSTNPVKEWDR
ncbi:MAG TPA: AraC family transcriptional regulator [Myxococcales bacterium LLY-WYZ-16_1]|nr:AraC family transcriptional regulator [Myxococcales bacterium LLY-WYZ-16_1]